MNLVQIFNRLLRRFPFQEAAVRAVVDDSEGWRSEGAERHDDDFETLHTKYADQLAVWRNNPIAWRIIAITTDYVVGEQLQISSPHPGVQRFVSAFWEHPQNRMAQRLEGLCDELSRSGDLFIALFRNPQDGMSYLRVVTKDRIRRIETAENDWERELAYVEQVGPGESRAWLSPQHPDAPQAEAVMLHYTVNRPAGALLGESDLASMVTWLQFYARLLEDRVRLHWAARAFLWVVTVPHEQVAFKREQYRNPPNTGSVIIKEDTEKWETVSPDLRAQDARWDMQAVRQLIDAGSGYPPHWRGEPGDANLATAQAMQGPTERHLQRRQQYFLYLLKDIVLHAYLRAAEIGMARPLGKVGAGLLEASSTEISQQDNENMARAAQAVAGALETLAGQMGRRGPAFDRLALEMVTRFAGRPLSPEQTGAILTEAASLAGKSAREEKGGA